MARKIGRLFILCMALISVILACTFYLHHRHQAGGMLIAETSHILFSSIAHHQTLQQEYDVTSAVIEQTLWQSQQKVLHRKRSKQLKKRLQYEPANIHLWGALIESQHNLDGDVALIDYGLQQILAFGNWHKKWRFHNSFYCLTYRGKLSQETNTLCDDLLKQTLLQTNDAKRLMRMTNMSEAGMALLFEKVGIVQGGVNDTP